MKECNFPPMETHFGLKGKRNNGECTQRMSCHFIFQMYYNATSDFFKEKKKKKRKTFILAASACVRTNIANWGNQTHWLHK